VLLAPINAHLAMILPGCDGKGTAERSSPEYDGRMIRYIGPGRTAIFALAIALTAGAAALPAAAQDSRKAHAAAPAKSAGATKTPAKADPKAARPAKGEAAKPGLLETYGDWATYAAGSGKAKTCYALGRPKEAKREQAYVFVSTRPGESVRNEVSIVMGFDVKADAASTAVIGKDSFELVAKGANLWIAIPNKEPAFVDALRKGSALVVKASPKRGAAVTDTYSLKGLGQALERVGKECP
jgi:hypothetical protein